MVSPTQPVHLDVPQVEDLARHFSAFRHDVNGCLSLIVAATELIRYNPDVIKRMANTLVEQPPRIAGKTVEFTSHCQRSLGLRPPSDPSWYLDLWPRQNASPTDFAAPVTLTAAAAKNLHTEIIQLGKDLMQMGFILSGAHTLAVAQPAAARDVTLTGVEQMAKASKRFTQLAHIFESAAQVQPGATKRLASGSPSGPVTLSPDQVMLFDRRLGNLRRDINEHLRSLLELSELARNDPKQVQTRAGEFSQQPPKISDEVARFATEFDRTFQIVRATM